MPDAKKDCFFLFFFSLFYCNMKTYTVHNISTGTIHYVYTNIIQDINNTSAIHKVKKKEKKILYISDNSVVVCQPRVNHEIFLGRIVIQKLIKI